MENKKFPEETGELMDETIVIPELEIEAEPMGQSAEDILETIIDEEGNLNLDATLDMTLEEVEALLNTENAPEQTDVFAPEETATEETAETVPEIIYSDMDIDFPEPEYDEGFRATEADEDFDSKFRAPSQSVIIEDTKPREPRKGRPKRKKGYGLFGIPHLIATCIWLAIIVSIGVSLGRMLWLCAADVLAFGREDKAVTITIGANDSIEDIAEILHKNQLIRYPELFKLYASLAVDEGEIATGTFTLNTLYDYHALSTSMSEKPAMRVTVKVTIPEGYNCAQIFKLLEEKEVCTVAELENYASNSQFADYWFLEGTERGNKYCLEGFLFPDTYEFYVDSDAKEVYIKLLAAFDYRFTDTMKEKLVKLNEYLNAKMKKQGLDQSYIDSHQITIREVVIIASLIEKESSGIEDDSYNISSVIYNRLTNPGNHPYLGLNSTLVYYTGRSELTSEDFQDDHPYNTYTRPGLVPGPIANPGRASLDAALDPSDTGYYYFVLNPKTGTHEYSKTYAEHQQKVEEFAKLEGQ